MVIVAQFCEKNKSHWIVHTKCVNFIVCELYLNKAAKKSLSTALVPAVTQAQNQTQTQLQSDNMN